MVATQLLIGFVLCAGVPAYAADADRDVAVWALHMGGFVVLEGDTRRIRTVDDLPSKDYRIKVLNGWRQHSPPTYGSFRQADSFARACAAGSYV